MKSKARIAMAACAFLFLAACSPSPQQLIVGKWEVEGAPMKMTAEFGEDGTARLSILGQTVRGTYKVNGENELEWSLNGKTTKSKITITPTELELTDAANRTIKYKRR